MDNVTGGPIGINLATVIPSRFPSTSDKGGSCGRTNDDNWGKHYWILNDIV
jgi:hypothetical protein